MTPTSPACDDLSTPERLALEGGPYAPYFIPGFATGDASSGTSTFYYAMSAWNPYTQVIMQTTIAPSSP